MTGYGTLKINASLASPVDKLEIIDRVKEKAHHKKNKLLKARERCIRGGRNRLEAELQTLIFKRCLDLSEKYELKEA